MGEASGIRHCQRLFRLNAEPKRVTRGTHRLRAADEMLASVRPLLPRAGVTRLANITGLDRIGLPVVVGVRPNGRTLSQAAGKGLTLDQALISAAMESIELFHAETAELAQITTSYVELATQHAVIPLADLPLSRHSIFSPLTAERWAFGWDLIAEGSAVSGQGSGAPAQMIAVPADMVVLPRRPERVTNASLFSFQTTSNGLASGSAFAEALTVALLEVIERDAIACWRDRPTPRVRLDGLRDFPLASEVLEHIHRAGVHAVVYDCTVDTDVPVYRAVLYDAAERRVGLAEGWGAHLETELALVQALTEAAQSRAVSIAGARDDRFGRDIARLKLTDSPSRICELEAQPETVDLRAHQSAAGPTFAADVECLLARLERVGVTQAIAVDLTRPDFQDVLAVVRVIVPKLAGLGVEQSRRATAFRNRANN